jgi:hypothetical protein
MTRPCTPAPIYKLSQQMLYNLCKARGNDNVNMEISKHDRSALCSKIAGT